MIIEFKAIGKDTFEVILNNCDSTGAYNAGIYDSDGVVQVTKKLLKREHDKYQAFIIAEIKRAEKLKKELDKK